MSQIYWDSMVFIYLLESHPQFSSKVERILKQIEVRGDTLITSVFTIGEVLTGPRRAGVPRIVDAIKSYFDSGRVVLLPFDKETADRYSILRSSLKVSQADGIHLATAAIAGADMFVTNDQKLWAMHVPGIKFMVDLDGKVF
ncbi:type II toxin-antitoxin system VapC family toxin [Acidobacteria bacterium AB60]|nr:type II toxin-antitoxin system VapC family toxin [Acidobacteria bacterium AB60]